MSFRDVVLYLLGFQGIVFAAWLIIPHLMFFPWYIIFAPTFALVLYVLSELLLNRWEANDA